MSPPAGSCASRRRPAPFVDRGTLSGKCVHIAAPCGRHVWIVHATNSLCMTDRQRGASSTATLCGKNVTLSSTGNLSQSGAVTASRMVSIMACGTLKKPGTS